MPFTKTHRITTIAILGAGLIVPVFFFMNVFQSKPVNNPPVHGQSKKATEADYNNCIILYGRQAVFISGEIMDTLSPDQIIPAISKHRRSVRNSIFNIIVSPEADNDMLLPALDACTSSDIDNYRFLEF